MTHRKTGLALALSLCAPPLLAQEGPLQYTAPTGARYYAQRDTGAIARAEGAVARDPRNVNLLIQLGIAQASAMQYREAIATYARGMAIAPGDALLYRYRGHRYISVRQFDSSLADLTRGSWLDTTNYDIWYHLGVAHYVKGQFSSAADAFAHAQRLAPNDNEVAGSTDWLWMSLRRAGREAEARTALARIRDSMRITSATAYFQRLKLYRGLIGPEQVLAPADTVAIQLATLLYGVGNWYLVNRDTARAREHFRRAVSTSGWPAFGFIASEVELNRMR